MRAVVGGALVLVLALVASAFATESFAAGPRAVAVTSAARKPAAPAAVVAVLEGMPGSGKTTICQYVGRVRALVEKDVDSFTQPVLEPRHPASATAEGVERAARWGRFKASRPGADEFVVLMDFLHSEIRAYIDAAPKGVSIVFCGLASGTVSGRLVDVMPPELAGVPRYLLRPSRIEVAKRAVHRVLANVPPVYSCEEFKSEYADRLRSALLEEDQYELQDLSRFALVTGDGGRIIEEVLTRARASKADIAEAVGRYRGQPTADRNLLDLSARYGEYCRQTFEPYLKGEFL